ncbi:MAG: Hsp20/alpha crystallin family protein [Anaerolinea sp.]|nr:Hsp20/alpha crystallin family protein [Anaerolinea sp.]MCC6975966.1 Hsp20/alpha crystallin family protein [Anaerolineae bacterium]CAG0993297.1 Spore protein SP21 [Anaerolineae bacterium]
MTDQPPSSSTSSDSPAEGSRFDPMRTLRSIGDSVSRVIEDGLASINAVGPINLDIYETEDSVVVKAGPMWGVDVENVDVSITGDTLTLKGETRPEVDIPAEAYLRRERKFGEFSRTVKIPRALKAGEASADLRDGILTIVIPKEENPQPKVVNIRTVNG